MRKRGLRRGKKWKMMIMMRSEGRGRGTGEGFFLRRGRPCRCIIINSCRFHDSISRCQPRQSCTSTPNPSRRQGDRFHYYPFFAEMFYGYDFTIPPPQQHTLPLHPHHPIQLSHSLQQLHSTKASPNQISWSLEHGEIRTLTAYDRSSSSSSSSSLRFHQYHRPTL